jgi:hypothetical protein
MKVNTSELIGDLLDLAVAHAVEQGKAFPLFVDGEPMSKGDYSTEWSQGGPIIERYGIELNRYAGEWMATLVGRVSISEEQGPTQLIAAMRCYVASVLGDEILVPDDFFYKEMRNEMRTV